MSLRPRPGRRTRSSRGFEPFSATDLPRRSSGSAEPTAGRPQTPSGCSSAAQAGPSDAITLHDIHNKCQAIANNTAAISERLKKVEEKTGKIAVSLREFKDVMKEHYKKTFNAKGSSFEIPIKREMAKLFCLNLKRKPEDKDVQDAVVQILGQEARDKHKFEILLSFAKNKLTEFRTEERRKVLGMAPYQKLCSKSTRELTENILHSMHADIESTIYYRHLVLLRKFAHASSAIPGNFYAKFREWVDVNNYQSLTEEQWEELEEEDGRFQHGVADEEQEVEEELITNLEDEFEL